MKTKYIFRVLASFSAALLFFICMPSQALDAAPNIPAIQSTTTTSSVVSVLKPPATQKKAPPKSLVKTSKKTAKTAKSILRLKGSVMPNTLIVENISYSIGKIFFVSATLSDSSRITVTGSQNLSVSADRDVARISQNTIRFLKSGNVTFRYTQKGIVKQTQVFVNVKKLIPKKSSKTASVQKGIDLSYHDGVVDFNAIKQAGASFVILRTGYGNSLSNPNQVDKMFYTNYQKAKAAGLDVGAYHFSYASSVSDAVAEAKSMIAIVKGHRLEYPLYFDYEEISDPQGGTPGKVELTNRAVAFLSTLRENGYYPGLYLNENFYTTRYDMSRIIGNYDIWYADVYTSIRRPYQCGIHQNGIDLSLATWPGVSGYCDTNLCYIDYPTKIKASGLNGY